MVGNATAEKMMPKAHMYNLCITDEKNKKKMFISNSKKKILRQTRKIVKKRKNGNIVSIKNKTNRHPKTTTKASKGQSHPTTSQKINIST